MTTRFRGLLRSHFLLGFLAIGCRSSTPAPTAPNTPDGQTTPASSQASLAFQFKLDRAAPTSAGVYDGEGRLVRSLWAMKPLKAGEQNGEWNGLDDLGQLAPAGDYTFRVIVNPATYENVGAIGNSGDPSVKGSHTPEWMEAVAVDPAGAVYTANAWDEGGEDFKKWSRDGKSVFDAEFAIRNGDPNGLPYAIAADDKYFYCAVDATPTFGSKQQLQRFRVSDGKAEPFTAPGVDAKGHVVALPESPATRIATAVPSADAALMRRPIRALALQGTELLAADALHGRVLRFDKETGAAKGGFPVPLPNALAVGADGRVWVGHEHHKLSVFSPDGKPLGDAPITIGEVESLAFDPTGHLYVADSVENHVAVYDVRGAVPALVRTFGQKALPGDRDPSHFFHLRGVAVNASGNMLVIQNEPISGARLAKFGPDGKLAWEHFGNEFVSMGSYGSLGPDVFVSTSLHEYQLLSHPKGTWTYLANEAPAGEWDRTFPNSVIPFRAGAQGVPRLLRLGGGDFFFAPEGDGVAVYRVAKGAVAHMAAFVGGRLPAADGLAHGDERNVGEWSWSDVRGEGVPRQADIRWFKPADRVNYGCLGMDVDSSGNIWFASTVTQSIWEIPLGPPDARGNPTYDWATAHEVIPKDTSPLGFQPTMAQRAEDGSLYAFGFSKPWPFPTGKSGATGGKGGLWMGGTTLARFAPSGQRMWAVPLPNKKGTVEINDEAVGLDTIPGGGGCVVGISTTANLLHYSDGGLLLGRMAPGKAMAGLNGMMDTQASVAVNRDPRDGAVNVFAEDDLYLKISWYRFSTKGIEAIDGKLHKP